MAQRSSTLLTLNCDTRLTHTECAWHNASDLQLQIIDRRSRAGTKRLSPSISQTNQPISLSKWPISRLHINAKTKDSLRIFAGTDAHKVVKFLDSLQELEQHLSELPFPVHYCLILLGGLPSHPKRAFLVDFVGSSPQDTFTDEAVISPSTPNRSEPIFSDFFRSFVQHPFYQLLMEGAPPTRTFFYFYMPTNYESKWFLPRPNFRLFRKCPVYVLQILTDSKHSMILDDLEADRCLLDINKILYGESSDRMWYASPVSVEGFRGGVV
ncbi:hypothetical protein X801_09311 [Opisthorchis viverrini]|uniref:Uncharacterized protein n=1 Tax=Opisthorchis viverrini TaxID=6198 RepID=A0A1S8WKC0_OPIVI|nr:hypothetical protein X801_09311 [Opisthorchis viverrini]